MAKPNEIKYSQAQLYIDNNPIRRVQSVGFTSDLNSEDVRELGNASIVEIVDGVPSVTATIDLNEFGNISLENRLSGFYDASDNTNYSAGYLSDASFAEVASDILLRIREGGAAATAVSRALWLSNCYIDSISGTCQVDGFATQSVSLSGAAQSWFLNAYASAKVVAATYINDATVRPVNPALYNSDSSIGSVAIALTENGVRLSNSYWTMGTSATKDITAIGGFTFTSGSRYRLVYVPAITTWQNVSDYASTNKVGGVKEQEIDIYLWQHDSTDSTTPAVGGIPQRALRVQSVDYEVSFDRESLKQIYNGEYAKGLNETNITATISVLDSDLEMYAKTAKKDFSSTNEITLADFQASKTLFLRIDIHNTKTSTSKSAATLLKQIILGSGKLTSTGDSFDVPGRGTSTFDLEFTSFIVCGTGRTGR